MPYVGTFARAWVRATHVAHKRAQWAVLPPTFAS